MRATRIKNSRAQRQRAIVTAEVTGELIQFLETIPVRRLTRNLRFLLIEYMLYEGGEQAVFLKDLLYDLRGLFELLDKIETVQKETVSEEAN